MVLQIESKCSAFLNLISYEKNKILKGNLIKVNCLTNKSNINIDLYSDKIITEKIINSNF